MSDKETLKFIAEAGERAKALLIKHRFVFKRFPRNMEEKPPINEEEKWEALAFSLYTDIWHLASLAEQELNQDER